MKTFCHWYWARRTVSWFNPIGLKREIEREWQLFLNTAPRSRKFVLMAGRSRIQYCGYNRLDDGTYIWYATVPGRFPRLHEFSAPVVSTASMSV